MTSPLRRYPDFITHYQIKAMLRGGKKALPFSLDDLSKIMPEVHYTSKKIHSLQKNAILYWKTQYLIQEKRRKETYQSYYALIIFIGDEFGKKEFDRIVQVHIPALQLNTSIRVNASASSEFKEGDLIQLVVDHKEGAANVSFIPFETFPMRLQELVDPPEPIEKYIPQFCMFSLLYFF